MYRGLLSISVALAYTVGVHSQGINPFKGPRSYEYFKQKATCSALNRHGGEGVPDAVSIDIGYLDINPSAPRTILMVHGWPSTWVTWIKQIPHFEKKYHLLVPNQRGFASSSHPGDVEASGTIGDMVGDMVCVLDHAGVQRATCLGHDWGSQVCWEAARMRPDRFEAVAGVTVPYLPSAGNFVPVEDLAHIVPKLSYQIYFEKNTTTATTELNNDIRRSIRAVHRTIASPPPEAFLSSTTDFLGAWSEFKEIPPPPFYSHQEEDYLVEQFSQQKFNYTLQFYTQHNRFESYRLSHEQGNATIPQPALFVAPLEDPVANWTAVMELLGSAQFIPQLTTKKIHAQHWPHLEAPAEFNRILDEWLEVSVERPQPVLALQRGGREL